jgi:outer membrane protein assembly factor BamD (BamD/ComL family)
MNSLEKKNWDKARAQLSKALRKDTVNAAARYVLACYFAEAANPAHHLDSAHLHAILALADLQKTDLRERERLKRFPLDSTILTSLSQRVDSAAFEKARALNTEEAYVHFLDIFATAAERPQAIALRDEVAYLAALRENTYTAFATFLQKYPASPRAPDVKARY